MSISVEGVLLLALVLLPGAYARIAAARIRAEPWSVNYRSQLQEFLEVLLYSVVIGLITVLSLAAIAVAYFSRESDIRLLIEQGLAGFPPSQRVDGFVWLIVYFGSALVIADLVGQMDLITRVRASLATLLGFSDAFEHEPIWFWALGNEDVPVKVITKHGEVYRGLIGLYPIVDDKNAERFRDSPGSSRRSYGRDSYRRGRRGVAE